MLIGGHLCSFKTRNILFDSWVCFALFCWWRGLRRVGTNPRAVMGLMGAQGTARLHTVLGLCREHSKCHWQQAWSGCINEECDLEQLWFSKCRDLGWTRGVGDCSVP